MSEITFFSYDEDSINRAATGAATTADEIATLIGSVGGALATVSGSLLTVAALQQCAGTWTSRLSTLGDDVQLVSQNLTDSLAGYRGIEDAVALVLDRVNPF
jgi:hypothetical protein